MPKMFEKEVYFLELKRNLYGQVKVEAICYEHLCNGLEQQGLKSSALDGSECIDVCRRLHPL